MECPYCNSDMKVGYLRGSHSYAILWTDNPFKVTPLLLGDDFWICKETDINRPIAYICNRCNKIVLNLK